MFIFIIANRSHIVATIFRKRTDKCLFEIKLFLEVNVFISVNCACFVFFFRSTLMTIPFISDSVCCTFFFDFLYNETKDNMKIERSKANSRWNSAINFFFCFYFSRNYSTSTLKFENSVIFQLFVELELKTGVQIKNHSFH